MRGTSGFEKEAAIYRKCRRQTQAVWPWRRVQTVALFPEIADSNTLFSTRSVALFRKKFLLALLSTVARAVLATGKGGRDWPKVRARDSSCLALAEGANGSFVSRNRRARPCIFNEIGSFVP
jgi:hypothetical protein